MEMKSKTVKNIVAAEALGISLISLGMEYATGYFGNTIEKTVELPLKLKEKVAAVGGHVILAGPNVVFQCNPGSVPGAQITFFDAASKAVAFSDRTIGLVSSGCNLINFFPVSSTQTTALADGVTITMEKLSVNVSNGPQGLHVSGQATLALSAALTPSMLAVDVLTIAAAAAAGSYVAYQVMKKLRRRSEERKQERKW